ncbi:CRISP/Allergen/PR-1-like [Pollicipes pollicipes]|uniref:CRISP/Allergen/PR-1-like n=1 Tax=Pollicipes pollicipes TaxID=41117 RepID=UPI001885840C|nr:CRISP/Allergen/PR-1-like [Pollicipes pollicipes]
MASASAFAVGLLVLQCALGTRFFVVGQNIAALSTSQRGVENLYQKVLDLAQTWFAESVHTSVDFVNTFYQGCCHTGTYGHFAQAVWSITRYIGCGVVTHQGGLGTKVLLYCNYGPGGNVVSKPTYRMGRKCSACPQGTKCNSRYDGLCNMYVCATCGSLMSPITELTQRAAAGPPAGCLALRRSSPARGLG